MLLEIGQSALQIGILWPIPIAPGQLVSKVRCAVHGTAQKNTAPNPSGRQAIRPINHRRSFNFLLRYL
jgi:hypothetical protein